MPDRNRNPDDAAENRNPNEDQHDAEGGSHGTEPGTGNEPGGDTYGGGPGDPVPGGINQTGSAGR